MFLQSLFLLWSYRGHRDKHVVDAVPVGQVGILPVAVVLPGVARVLQKEAEASASQNLKM